MFLRTADGGVGLPSVVTEVLAAMGREAAILPNSPGYLGDLAGESFHNIAAWRTTDNRRANEQRMLYQVVTTLSTFGYQLRRSSEQAVNRTLDAAYCRALLPQ